MSTPRCGARSPSGLECDRPLAHLGAHHAEVDEWPGFGGPADVYWSVYPRGEERPHRAGEAGS